MAMLVVHMVAVPAWLQLRVCQAQADVPLAARVQLSGLGQLKTECWMELHLIAQTAYHALLGLHYNMPLSDF